MKDEASLILHKLSHIKPEQVVDLVLTGGVNDLLRLLDKLNKSPKGVSREERERETDKILKDCADAVKISPGPSPQR